MKLHDSICGCESENINLFSKTYVKSPAGTDAFSFIHESVYYVLVGELIKADFHHSKVKPFSCDSYCCLDHIKQCELVVVNDSFLCTQPSNFRAKQSAAMLSTKRGSVN